MHVLLIEDDATIAEVTTEALTQAGYSVTVANMGEEGAQLARNCGAELIILDLMLPDMDGLDLLRALRKDNVHTPVIVVSARQSVEDRVVCLQAGGDDYLTKPFAMSELLARMEAIARRVSGDEGQTRLTRFGITLNLVSRTASRGGKEIELKGREFALLNCLMENAGQVVTRAMIMKRVWGYDFVPGSNVIDVHVCQLREKIEESGDRVIHTIKGMGYVFGTHEVVAALRRG